MQKSQTRANTWFKDLRDQMCKAFESVEETYAKHYGLIPSKFIRKSWDRAGGGGGEISILKGHVFEKIGVNISKVHGKFPLDFKKQIPNTDQEGNFFASGISVVAHMVSPLLPAAHFNTRYIITEKSWFGGGADLTPTYPCEHQTNLFHKLLKEICDKYDNSYYQDFKKQCDEYFFLKHRKEPRGVGGIFFDYLNTNDFDADFNFVQDLGICFMNFLIDITTKKMHNKWSQKQKEAQLIKRGRYVEFNLLYDRGTKFGLETGGNIEAILMSLPPEAKWP